MDKQAQEAKELAKQLSGMKKISYIWTYYRTWIIGVLLAVLVVGYTTYEIATRPSYDLEIPFYSDAPVSEETLNAVEAYLAQFIEDTDGNGIVTVEISNYTSTSTGSDIEGMAAIQTKLLGELFTGEYAIVLFEGRYAELMQKNYLEIMDSMIDINTAKELAAIWQLPEDKTVYWGVRGINGQERSKENAEMQYQKALELTEAVFGHKE